MAQVHLIRDVLDNMLTDVAEENAGKVDGLIVELRDGAPPRVAYIEVGPITAARRISRRLARWVARVDRRFGEGRGVPIRIPFTRVSGFGIDLKLDLRAEHTPIAAAERWLRERVVRHIPLHAAKGGRTDAKGKAKAGESKRRNAEES